MREAPKKKRNPGGHPPKLTAELQKEICDTLKMIGTVADAASKAGVGESTVYLWMQRGREGRGARYVEFLEAIKKARAARRLGMEGRMLKHSEEHWQALAWLMERTEPKLYAQRVVVHVTEELTDAVERLKAAFEDEPDTLERALAALVETDSWSGAAEAEDLEDGAQPGGRKALQPSLTDA